jgi:predicted ATPase
MLSEKEPDIYSQICETVRLAIPFFDDFVLKPEDLKNGERTIKLFWRQKESDYIFWPHQLSDGSIRFICLTAALLQPNPPSTIIIDEPEIGLHPYAITLLGALLQSASTRMQVIVSTQSVDLVNEFSIDDLVIVERVNGATTFRRENQSDFEMWLEDYTTGELWEKNVLGGRPSR